MPQSLNQIFEKVVELLKEQVHIVLIVAIIVVFCLILIVIKKMAKRSKIEAHEESLDFIESLRNDIEEKKAEEKEQSIGEQAAQTKQKSKPEQIEEEPQVQQIKQEPQAEQIKQAFKDEILDEKGKLQVILLQELIEEITKISTHNLEEVQIKIQGAEVRLKYTGAGTEGQVLRCETKVFEEDPKEKNSHENSDKYNRGAKEFNIEIEPEEEDEENLQQDAEVDPAEEEILKFEEMLKEMQRQRAEEEKVAAELFKKFGTDNYNTTRTGRVFTEKELEQQIRD